MRKSMKKTAVMLMAVFMVITFMPGVAVKAFAENGNISKNAEGYYEINDAKDICTHTAQLAKRQRTFNRSQFESKFSGSVGECEEKIIEFLRG